MIKFVPTVEIYIALVLLLPSLILCIWQFIVVNPKRYDSDKITWFRRILMVLCLVIIACGPSLRQSEKVSINTNLNYLFVVDRTGSMSALDGEQQKVTRLKTAQTDINNLSKLLPPGKYSAITYGSYASLDLPWTKDVKAFRKWANALTPELTKYSDGSDLTKPIDLIKTNASATYQKNPYDQLIIFYITDGENNVTADFNDFKQLSSLFYGGYVVGYGTSAGAKMLNYSLGSNTVSYIIDPKTNKDAISKANFLNIKEIANKMEIKYIARNSHDDILKVASSVYSNHYHSEPSEISAISFNLFIWPFEILFALLTVWELFGQLTLKFTNKVSK